MEPLSNMILEENVWLIDTDYSLDDQLALRYLILIKKINIIAITVNSAGTGIKPDVIKRKIESDLLNIFKLNIPVYAGADRPYINYQTELKDDPIFDSYNFRKTDFSEYEQQVNSDEEIGDRISNIAAVKIAEFVRIHSKQLNILTLGALTNLSLAVLIDSTIKDRINNLFIVGGSYNNLGNSGNCAEYNFRVDPVAAKNVFGNYKNITMIPVEIEKQINFEEIIKLSKNVSNDYSYKVFFEYLYTLNMEDETRSSHSFLGLLGSIIAVNPSSIKTQVIRPCDVDIIGRFTRGALSIEKYDYLISGKFHNVNIIEDVEEKVFLENLKNILL